MNYRVLGRTGIRVSEIGLGAEGYGNKSYMIFKALIDAAISCGVTYFDLFNPSPVVRSYMGKALAGRRDDVVIQGHICTAWETGQYLRTRDITKVRTSHQDLLERLGTDYIDVGMLHFVDGVDDFNTIFNGPVIEFVKDLRARGTIRCIGMSFHNPKVAMMAAQSGLIDVIMFSVNPAYDLRPGTEALEDLSDNKSYRNKLSGIDPERDKLYKYCAASGIALTVMKSFAGGALLDVKQSPFGVALTTTQCLHYSLTRPAVASVLAGCFTPKQMKQVAGYSDSSEPERDYATVLGGAPRHAFRGHCMYCGHCAPCTIGIDVATVNKYLDLCLAENTVPDTVKDHYALLAHHASDCVQCGICETNCPFGVTVAERMQRAAEIFGY